MTKITLNIDVDLASAISVRELLEKICLEIISGKRKEISKEWAEDALKDLNDTVIGGWYLNKIITTYSQEIFNCILEETDENAYDRGYTIGAAQEREIWTE